MQKKRPARLRLVINWPRLLLVLSLLALCATLGVVCRLRQENLRLAGLATFLQGKLQATDKVLSGACSPGKTTRKEHGKAGVP